MPGRVNETWFNADQTGIYYGQCDQLCGIDHAFMPIEVKVVSQADFDAWVRQQGAAAAGRARRPPRRRAGRPPRRSRWPPNAAAAPALTVRERV